MKMKTLLLILCTTLTSASALTPQPPDPADRWTVDFETGSLWRISDSTHLDYVVLPQMISLRSPAHFRFDLGPGEVTLRVRLTLLGEAVARGPESGYFGFSCSPSVEYWLPKRTTCFYFSAGGGCGVIDSRGVAGGQGQDFTLNWFAAAGVRHYLRRDFALSAGLMFQHLSNGGATNPNPGLDSLGPVLGATWHF